MMKPIRIETTSANGSKLNLEALYQIAPSCFTEVLDGSDKQHEEETITVEKDGRHVRMAINFKTLRQLLGDAAVEDSEEMYQFTWPGKQSARREAATPIADTLRPVTEDSVDWDTTENLYIEGDNLRVLKLLQRGYMGKVKMIYIDPPYNTGNDFVYHDDFKTSLADEELAAGNIDEEGLRYRKNLDGNGRFHSDWCSMMYSRLLVARSLLTEDGVIFISIDDHEVHNLRKICDEVFGERNFVSQFTRVTKKGGKSSTSIAKNHDFVFLYAKQAETANLVGVLHNDEGYALRDEFFEERGYYKLNQTLDYDSLGYVPSLDYPISINGMTLYAGGDENLYYQRQQGNHGRADWGWRWSKDLYSFGYENGFIVLKTGGQRPRIYTKTYQKVKIEKVDGVYKIMQINRTKPLSTLEFIDNIYSNDNAKKGIDELLDKGVFEYTKPVSLIKRLMHMISDKNSLILDFFSGSATTAHAVMKLNAEDGGNRKYIMVQYAEETPEKSEARKAGYKNICEIGKERIRRAGKKIKEESPLTTQHLDIGFRVFRLSSSNYEDVTKQPGEYDQRTLDLFADNIKADRTDLDLLFGAMLSWGVQLSLPMTTEEVDGCKIYTVDGNSLVACFAENITENVAKAMADKLPVRVLFRDSCFSEDKTKINIFELFKQKLNWDDKEAKDNIKVV